MFYIICLFENDTPRLVEEDNPRKKKMDIWSAHLEEDQS